jgi:kelch-like protein 10
MDVIRTPKSFGNFVGLEGLRFLNELRAKNVLCDAVLRTEDGGSFPVHSTLLFIHSDLFRFVY